MGIIAWLIVGLIVGAIARLLVPGRDPIGFFGTILLGIVGSFIGGLLVSLIFYQDIELRPAGWIGSIIGAVIALLIYRRVGSRRAVV